MSTRMGLGVLLLVAPCLLLTACGGSYCLYSGPPTTSGGTQRSEIEGRVLVKSRAFEVDGKKSTGPLEGRFGSSFNGSFNIELLPGEHTLLVGYYSGGL